MQRVLNAIRRIRLGCLLSLVLIGGPMVPNVSAASSVSQSGDWRELHGTTMGTTYRVKYRSTSGSSESELQTAIDTRLDEINASMSTYRADSELSRINRAMTTDWLPISTALYAVINTALRISHESDGAFDITVAPLVDLWGFGPAPSVSRPPNVAAITLTQARVGYRRLALRASPPALRKRRSDVRLDLSAIAKGYGVDEVKRLLRRRNIDHAWIEIAGEIATIGANANGRPWQVGLIDPRDNKGILRVVDLTEEGAATSGDYRIFFDFDGQRYSHVIDPRTGTPVTHTLSQVSVIHASTMMADAYSTALMVLGPDSGPEFAERLGLSAVFCVRRGRELATITTSGFDRRHPR